jgi:hypothetical protein
MPKKFRQKERVLFPIQLMESDGMSFSFFGSMACENG